MPRTFAYLRVSTAGQTTDNQLQEIKAAGLKVEPRRVIMETISGNVATSQRRGFTRLLDRVEPGGRAKRLPDYLPASGGAWLDRNGTADSRFSLQLRGAGGDDYRL
jgi:hypothetical protein